MSVIVFVVLLGALIFVHELGHFILAKRAGVKVEEFGIGFPPRLFGFRRGETDYTINAIPLGGFVRMLGEEDPTAPRSFASASRLWRIAILAAGASMNLVAAVLLFSGAYLSGWPAVTQANVVVTLVAPNTPAAQSGLQPGDTIRAFAGQTITRSTQLRGLTDAHLGQPIPLVVERNGKAENLTVTPRTTWPSDQGPLGVSIREDPTKVEPVRYSLPSALLNGLGQTIQTILLTLSLPVLILKGLIPIELARPVGPVGIFQVASQATAETVSTGWLFPILTVAAMISAGLGIANLLPIPGLDGGRLLFVIIEAIRGRRISPRRESAIHFAGLVFLVSLVVVVTYFDLLFPVQTDFLPK